jgi:hypothetical protein
MTSWWQRHAAQLILAGALLLTALVLLPGLSGPWLVDDDYNLGPFNAVGNNNGNNSADSNLSYHDVIFGNVSGPLGRPVAMASFAANHALGLFSTPALKATNILIHLGNGLLLYLLLSRLFRRRNPVAENLPSDTYAALLAAWWLLLPMHISTVLYIVQRMTEIATFFSLASCLSYAAGREAQENGRPQRGIMAVTASLLLFFPLAIFAKESAFCTLAWLLLIELFFFKGITEGFNAFSNAVIGKRFSRPQLLTALVVLVIAAGVAAVLLLSLQNNYVWRDFTLGERLLTQPRVIASYVGDIFLPNSSSMGVFRDDFTISHSLFAPWTTALALLTLGAALTLGVRLADSRWWGVSFGLLFYLAGHLVESTIISLELYFEHRNYLPSIGLLIAASSALLLAWSWRRALLVVAFSLYLALLGLATLQRSQIWGNKDLLLATSAHNHPHSVRAWTDYTEALLMQGKGLQALQTALQGADNNPELSGIFYLHALSIYCRSEQAPPAALIAKTGEALSLHPGYSGGMLTPLSIGLDYTLTRKKEGHCLDADFSPLMPALIAQDRDIIAHYGPQRSGLWLLRLTLGEWLIETGDTPAALGILRDTWAQPNKSDMPMVGLVLAQTLHRNGDLPEMRKVLQELGAVTQDAPPDFQEEVHALMQDSPAPKSPGATP